MGRKNIFFLILFLLTALIFLAKFSSGNVIACSSMCDDGCGCRSLGQACGEGSASCRMVGGCVGGRCVANQACGCGGCGSDADCGGGGGGGGGGGDDGGGGGCDANNWGGWSACSAGCGGGTQSRTNACGNSQSQACNTQACPTPTPTPIIVPVMGLKVGKINTGINDGSIVLSWQDLLPVKIKSKAMTSQITYMGVLFSDGFSSVTNSLGFEGENTSLDAKSSSQKSLIQNIISSLLSILNPFSF